MKTRGFKVRIDAFLPINTTDFREQAKAYQAIADMNENGKVPDDFFKTATITAMSVKQGTADLPAPAEFGSVDDPAATPLTKNPMPEGAQVISFQEGLDQTIIQTVKLADGNTVTRRISDMQHKTEQAASQSAGTSSASGKGRKRAGQQ